MGIKKFESFVCESGLNVRKLKKRVITTDGIREEQDKNLT